MDTHESSQGHVEVIENEIHKVMEQIQELIKKQVIVKDASELEALERRIVQTTDRLASLIVAQKVQDALDSDEVKQEASELAKAYPKKLKNQGPREVEISTSRGEPVKVIASYYSQKERKNKLRKKKRRGFYPSLVLLGICDHCTPWLGSEISTLATALSSFKEAEQILKDRGLNIDAKRIREITRRFAERARLSFEKQECNFVETVAGRRVVVSTDGGRIRIRKDKAGAKTKKGRKRYSTDWREPKLLIIYTVNEKGEKDRSFSSFMDGTLKGPNAVFALMKYYLSKLDICKAKEILFVADGARWIWNRVEELMYELGIASSQYHELLDFYHAVEHLGKIASLQKRWSAVEKKKWIKKHRRLLLKGQVDKVISTIRAICKGRRSKKLIRERNYFVRNRKRMSYDRIADMGLPIGSGAMESAIRRVVNLRLKGASIFWHSNAAEAMLLLRCFFKAGRWEMLKNLTFSRCLTNAG